MEASEALSLAVLIVGSATFVAAVGAWMHARPSAPFAVTDANRGVFGLRRTGYLPVVVKYVQIPHHAMLAAADESGSEGPFVLRRGRSVFLGLAGLNAPVDIHVLWRWRYGLKERHWNTHVL